MSFYERENHRRTRELALPLASIFSRHTLALIFPVLFSSQSGQDLL